MAQMYPRAFPVEAANDRRRRAEKAFYETLRDHLPAEWIVFYSIPWTAPQGTNGALRDGEADFVVLHPCCGWLVLELKGGSVGLDSESMTWWQETSDGRKTIAPFDQARRSMYELQKTLWAVPRDADLLHALSFGHGVVFPDAQLSPAAVANLPPSVHQEMIFDCTISPKHIERWLDTLLGAFAGEQAKTPLTRQQGQRVAALFQERLAPRLTLSTPLSVHLGLVEDRLRDLTLQQTATLQAMGVHRRLAVSGCAGSGKTMLALEKARTLAREGFHTLLLCYSPPLAAHLSDALTDSTSATEGSITVSTYDALVRELAVLAGSNPPSGNREAIANCLIESILSNPPPYNAILVDEGQDFIEAEWIALSFLAGDNTKSSNALNNDTFYVFYDNNQRLLNNANFADSVFAHKTLAENLQLMQWPLTQNVRNAVPVFEAVKPLYDAPLDLFSYGPSGPAVSYVKAPDESDLKSALRSRLHMLLYDERVPPERIVVLTPRTLADSALPDIWPYLPQPQNTVRFFDIAAFKGLEASVVIIVELDALFEQDPRRVELAYVGLSRARVQLILMGETETLQAIRKGLR